MGDFASLRPTGKNAGGTMEKESACTLGRRHSVGRPNTQQPLTVIKSEYRAVRQFQTETKPTARSVGRVPRSSGAAKPERGKDRKTARVTETNPTQLQGRSHGRGMTTKTALIYQTKPISRNKPTPRRRLVGQGPWSLPDIRKLKWRQLPKRTQTSNPP